MIALVESGMDPILISIQKYEDLKEMVRQGKSISYKDINYDSCALCYTQPNHDNEDCINCPLYKIDQQCKNLNSAWKRLRNVLLDKDSSSDKAIIDAIDDFITVLEKCKIIK